MAKRVADRQITDRDRDSGGEDDDDAGMSIGVQPQASGEELSKRKILKASRKKESASTGHFSGFSFGAAAAAGGSSPFGSGAGGSGGFSFGGAAAGGDSSSNGKPKPPPEFGAAPDASSSFFKSPGSAEGGSKPSFSFGGGSGSASKDGAAKPSFGFGGGDGAKKDTAAPSFSFGGKPGDSAPKDSTSAAKPSFSFGDKAKSPPTSTAVPSFSFGNKDGAAAKPPGFSFHGLDKKKEADAAAPTPATSSPFSLGTTPWKAPSPLGSSIAFPSANALTPAQKSKLMALNQKFKGYIDKQLGQTMMVDLSPGLEDYLEHVKKIKASIAASIPMPAASADDEDGEEAEKEPEAPPPAAPEDEDNLYKVRAKLYFQKKSADGSGWAERGVGDMLLVEDGEKVRLVMRNDSASRRVLLNVFLFPELTVKKAGKNSITFICVPNPPVEPKCVVCGTTHPKPHESNQCPNGCFGNDGCTLDDHKGKKAPPLPFLVKVKTPELADELVAKLEKYKKGKE